MDLTEALTKIEVRDAADDAMAGLRLSGIISKSLISTRDAVARALRCVPPRSNSAFLLETAPVLRRLNLEVSRVLTANRGMGEAHPSPLK